MNKSIKKIIPILSVGFILFLFSCGSKNAEIATKLQDEAFKIHDEVMPISMKLEDLREQVMKKVEGDSTKKAEALEISKELNDAYNEMEVWMPKLGDAADIKDIEAKIKAMTESKIEGLKIKEKTLAAKKRAEEFLK